MKLFSRTLITASQKSLVPLFAGACDHPAASSQAEETWAHSPENEKVMYVEADTGALASEQSEKG